MKLEVRIQRFALLFLKKKKFNNNHLKGGNSKWGLMEVLCFNTYFRGYRAVFLHVFYYRIYLFFINVLKYKVYALRFSPFTSPLDGEIY